MLLTKSGSVCEGMKFIQKFLDIVGTVVRDTSCSTGQDTFLAVDSEMLSAENGCLLE